MATLILIRTATNEITINDVAEAFEKVGKIFTHDLSMLGLGAMILIGLPLFG